MIAQVLRGSIRHRSWVVPLGLLWICAGVEAFRRLPLDAVPDLTNVQVQVLTSAPALGALDIERFVSGPLELALVGLPHLKEIRSLTRYGASAVTVVFADDVAPLVARQLVDERMPRLREAVPAIYGVPEMGPMSTGLGEIYQFEVRGDGYSPMALRTLLEWDIAPQLRMVPGVVDVNVLGGEVKAYEISVVPAQLVAANVSLSELFTALEANNRSAGGGSIRRGDTALLVRGDALATSLADIGNIVVTQRQGVPVHVHQLGEVRWAPRLRQGGATRDGRGEVVVGMAMMLMGENSRVVAQSVAAAVQSINASLPQGARVEPFYDRTAMVGATLQTVAGNLLEGAALVIVVLLLMLRNLRAGLVVASVIPMAMLGAFIGMRTLGISGNLMSLGALDFGMLVDGAIVLIENALHHIALANRRLGRALLPAEKEACVLQAALEVRQATAFGELLVALVYLPILALQGVEGRMFQPMAMTVLLALLGATLLSITWVPALAVSLLPNAVAQTSDGPMARLTAWYGARLQACVRQPGRTAALALALAGGALALGANMGSEFVPRLDEGAWVIETTRLPATALEETLRLTGAMETTLLQFPEVVTCISKTGRPEIANDIMGVEQSDVFVMLKPTRAWRPGLSRDDLIAAMEAALRRDIPGAVFGFSQPVEMRMNELISGVRSDLAVKIYGPDLPTLARLADEAVAAIARVPGARDVRAERVAGLPVLRVQVDRLASGRLGARASDILDAVAALGGRAVGSVFEGQHHVMLQVRLAPESRQDLDSVRQLPIRTAGEGLVLLQDVANIDVVDEPVLINHEATQRRVVVQANVRGRDLGSFAAEVRTDLQARLHLPSGYRLSWGGQYENLRLARERLHVVVPITLAAMLLLLWLTYRAWRPVLLIACTVPLATAGGIVALALRGLPWSMSAAVGFIALFGVAALNGLVLLQEMLAGTAAGLDPAAAAIAGAQRRLRPILTTALVAGLGFVPMALAQGAGAEVQRPLATVVIGGLLSACVLTLAVLPALFVRLSAGQKSA